MKLLFGGDSGCTPITLKRLMVIAQEIGFLDRPSVPFSRWVTIGSASPLRQFEYAMRESAIKLAVHTPPRGYYEPLYHDYLIADFANPDFLRIVFSGLRCSQ